MRIALSAVMILISVISVFATELKNQVIFEDLTEGKLVFKNGNEIMALVNPKQISVSEIKSKIFVGLESDVFPEKIDSTPVEFYKRYKIQIVSKEKVTPYDGVSNASLVAMVSSFKVDTTIWQKT